MKSIRPALVVVACAASFMVGRAENDAAAVIDADKAFNQSVAEKNLDHFRSLVADNATFGGGTPREVHGRDAVVQAWARFFAKEAPTLTWTPTKGEILAGGELGYTVGSYVHRGGTAAATVSRGHYLTVWRKQPDGVWRAVYDTGT